MKLRSGQKLHSAVCDAQVVVVRAPADDVELSCGGAPLLAEGEDAPGGAELDASLGEAVKVGKRYADEGTGLEVLCTRTGAGALTVGGRLVPMKGAKPLPASD